MFPWVNSPFIIFLCFVPAPTISCTSRKCLVYGPKNLNISQDYD